MTSTAPSPKIVELPTRVELPIRGFAHREPPVTAAYRTRKPFAVVHFEEPGKGLIAFLPEGAEVCIIGPSSIGKCVEILYQNRRYNIFTVDLLGAWAVPVGPAPALPRRAKPVRVLSAAVACA